MAEITPPRRRRFQFGLGAYLLWVVPYFAMLACVLAWRDETKTDEDFLDLGKAIFFGLKLFAAFSVTFLWVSAYFVAKAIGWWQRRRDARIAAQGAVPVVHPAGGSRRLPHRRLFVLAASLGIGLTLVFQAVQLATQPINAEAQIVTEFVTGIFVIGAGIGMYLDGPKLAILLGFIIPFLTCLSIFAALLLSWLIQDLTM
jgi:hypothetical protein